MTADFFFTLLNTVIVTLTLAVFQPVFKARRLIDLDEALLTRPFLAKALKRSNARSYIHHVVYCGLALLANNILFAGDDGNPGTPLASLSVLVLLAVSLARVWKYRRLLARDTESGYVQRFRFYPISEDGVVDADAVCHKVEQTPPNGYGIPSTELVLSDTIQCPACGSTDIVTRNHARRAGGAVGTVTGAAAGFASVMGGAELGATVGMAAGPVGLALGGLTGAMIAALLGGATGCAAGNALGKVIDDSCLDNYVCRDCGRTFSKQGR